MRILLTISLLFALCGSSVAQDQHIIDSLKAVIEAAKHLPNRQAGDTSVCNAYLSWGEEVYLNDPDTALILWQNAHDIAKENLASGLPAGQAGPPTTLEKKYLSLLAEALNNIGYIYKSQGDIPKGLEYYHKKFDNKRRNRR